MTHFYTRLLLKCIAETIYTLSNNICIFFFFIYGGHEQSTKFSWTTHILMLHVFVLSLCFHGQNMFNLCFSKHTFMGKVHVQHFHGQKCTLSFSAYHCFHSQKYILLWALAMAEFCHVNLVFAFISRFEHGQLRGGQIFMGKLNCVLCMRTTTSCAFSCAQRLPQVCQSACSVAPS